MVGVKRKGDSREPEKEGGGTLVQSREKHQDRLRAAIKQTDSATHRNKNSRA